MKLSLTLLLAMALTMSLFVGHGPGCASCLSWVCNRNQKLDVPDERQLMETKSQTSTRACWFGLTSCPIRIEDRQKNQVLPKEQYPVETKVLTSYWLCWLGLTSCPVRIKDGKNNQVLPKEQHPAETKILTSYWPCWLGPSRCPKWVWYRGSKVVVPEDPKQQSLVTKQKTHSLPGIPGFLWNYLVQQGRTWVITDTLITICILWMLTTACGLCKRLRRPQGQGMGQTASASSETECWGKDNEIASNLLFLTEDQIRFKESELTTPCLLQPQAHSIQQCRNTVGGTGKSKSPSADSSSGSSQSVRSVDGWQKRQQSKGTVSRRGGARLSPPKAFPVPNKDRIEHLLGQNARTSQKNELPCCPLMASKPKTRKIGLFNLGNTCYINSVIQSLFMASDFRHSVLNLTEGNCQPLMTKLQSLFALLEHSERPAISPESFSSASQPPWFTPGAQQDCSEYLKYLLARLHEEEKTGKRIYYQKRKEFSLVSQAMEHESLNKTLIEKMFGGKMMTKIRCLKCLNVSSREEAFTDLSLAFPPQDRPVCRPGSTSVLRAPEDSRSVGDLINYFLSPERLTAENQYHCEKCASLQDAEKVAELTEGPHYLILTLLRFSFDPQTMNRRKILDNVSIPEVLKLPILVSSEETEDICQHGQNRSDLGSTVVSAVYDLCSVVVHSGVSSESGHYYCYCRECTDTVPHAQPQDGTPKPASDKQLDSDIPWYLFNNHRVSTSSFESISNLTSSYPSATAYVLFYRQRVEKPSSPLHEAVAEARQLHSQTFLQ